jgi:hypothetical protein
MMLQHQGVGAVNRGKEIRLDSKIVVDETKVQA